MHVSVTVFFSLSLSRYTCIYIYIACIDTHACVYIYALSVVSVAVHVIGASELEVQHRYPRPQDQGLSDVDGPE